MQYKLSYVLNNGVERSVIMEVATPDMDFFDEGVSVGKATDMNAFEEAMALIYGEAYNDVAESILEELSADYEAADIAAFVADAKAEFKECCRNHFDYNLRHATSLINMSKNRKLPIL